MDTRLRMPAVTGRSGFAGRLLPAIATMATALWGSVVDASPLPGVIFILIVASAARSRWIAGRRRPSSPARPRSHRS